MSAALARPERPEFGGAVGAPAGWLLDNHEHTERCWWDLRQARWVCPRRPRPPSRTATPIHAAESRR